jgi:four helix bundle protein
MKDDLEPLRKRTTAFAVRVTAMYSALPAGRVAETLGFQAFRAGTSVGAHYREGCRARSDAEIISKLEGALQELDETTYWLELLVESKVVTEKRLAALRKEANELIAILVTDVKKIKGRKKT